MKIILAMAALFLLHPGTLPAQFEGVVRMVAVSRSDGDSSVVRSTVYFKGDLLAAVIEPAEQAEQGSDRGGKFILRGDRKLMWIVVDEERKVMEIPIGENTPVPPAHAPAKKSYALERTGKTGRMAGYACEEWVADEGGGKTARIWATKDLGDMYRGVVKWFDEMSMASATDGERWEREIAEKGLFPMSVTRMEDGELTESEEVLSVEEQSIAAPTFEPPEGYQVQKVDLNFEKMFEEMMKNNAPDSTGADDDDEGDETPDDDPGAGISRGDLPGTPGVWRIVIR